MQQVERQHLIAALDRIEDLNRAVRAPLQAAEVDARGGLRLGNVRWPPLVVENSPMLRGGCKEDLLMTGEWVQVRDLIRALQQMEDLTGQLRQVLESAEVGEGGRLRFRTPDSLR